MTSIIAITPIKIDCEGRFCGYHDRGDYFPCRHAERHENDGHEGCDCELLGVRGWSTDGRWIRHAGCIRGEVLLTAHKNLFEIPEE
jgi:hypothetical protein